ncbi:MAG: DUF4079 family protein [Alphaproteobacteria bacterium]|uniref:DUF4079 family protein n=1 Tax=Candidatus Nitrobium versatile TaxID=2884831 RepID=A0A953JB72_9BACT|nr:DUF4079 family protein [Candidatus Nitrobium versatile]
MIENQISSLFRIGHGIFNGIILFLLLYQGWLGIRIRKSRQEGAPLLPVIKKHRKYGPPLAVAAGAGLFSGIVLLFSLNNSPFPALLHYFIGSLLIPLVSATFLISRRIRGTAARIRTAHLFLGLLTLSLYLVQFSLRAKLLSLDARKLLLIL